MGGAQIIRSMFIIPYASMDQDIVRVLEPFPDREEIKFRCLVFTCMNLEPYEQE